ADMAAEVRMVLYEDDSVQVQYADGSTLQLSPCGSEFLFERAPHLSTHPLQQPERIRQRTHFVISTYREQVQRALDFRNSSATCPFLSESLIPPERKKHIFIDFSEVKWPSLDRYDSITYSESGTVKITSLDGHAYLCLPRSQREFTVHFLCKVSQKPDSSVILSETNNRVPKDKLVGKTSKICTCGSLSGQRLKNKEDELRYQILKSKEASANICCVHGAEGREELPSPSTKHRCVYTWVKQCWSIASCPEQWKYPLSLALRFYNQVSIVSEIDADFPASGIVTSDTPEESGKEVSVLPRALLLSCPAPHMHRWNFCDSLLQRQSDEEEYSYPELVKVVWSKGITFRLTHKNVNSIEIYPGDGSIFKSEGTYFGSYFTYYSSQEESEKREEKTYSVNNLPPDRPGSLLSVRSLIKQATRILQHCAKTRLSLSHNYHVCCWKMVSGVNVNNNLPVLLKESLIPSVGRFLAYSDDKVHAVFLDGVTLTLNWNFSSSAEKRQVNEGLNLGWCRLTFPDGQDQLIQTERPGAYDRYVTAVTSWCRRLTQTSPRQVPKHLSPVHKENWSVASELEKIQKFNWLLENSGVLHWTSSKKNEQCSDDCTSESSETSIEVTNKESVSVALKRTSEILQDIDCLLSNSRK
uniref:RIKEN cDNA 4833420G17 gene n=2 Tax=Cricetulus griseus TaxID=10029 RepID=A0A8C2QG90_CRIGR